MFDLAAWVQAARPLAQINIVVPLLFGQALAFAALGRFGPGFMLLAGLFGLLVQLVIVFVNDLSDQETDLHNVTYARVSGGSRVLAQGKLSPADLRGGAIVALGLLAVFSVGLALGGRPWMPVFAAAAVSLVWAYDRAPLRLAYRGRGELVQGLGTGVVLPLAGYYIQAGTLAGFHPWALIPLLLLGYIGNLLSALPDAPSDRVAGKRTYAVRQGQWATRLTAFALTAIASTMSALAVPGLPLWAMVLLAAPVLAVVALAGPLVSDADAEKRAECERFVMTLAGAGHLLVLLWSAVLVLPGLP
ncbi:MAG TPA: prenyltransferase [Nannocystis sp.]|jgi:1,4-dihydroxy-2-naphthoate octaprenyltransferase